MISLKTPKTAFLCICVLTSFLGPSIVHGQSAGRRPVRRSSGVTGVELGLEGALQVPRGGQLRWLLSAYEVVGLRDLRPAAGATIALTTSLNTADVAAEATTDEYGRALIELAVPEDAPQTFRVVLRLSSASEIQRRFELTVRTNEPRSLTLNAARSIVAPQGKLHVFGRLFHQPTGRSLPQERVELVLRDSQNRQLMTPVAVTTDRSGLYAHIFQLPEDAEGWISIQARAGDDEHPLRAATQITVAEPQSTAMILAVAPESVIVDSAQRVNIDVVLRTPNGRPVAGAVVALDGASSDRSDEHRGTTDNRGRARLIWTAPQHRSGFLDLSVGVTATREGYGQTRTIVPLRVAATDFAVAVAVEGGSLVPSLGGRLWIRVTGINGLPAGAEVPVTVHGPRLRGDSLNASTDASGVATFDVQLIDLPRRSSDRCGGDNATAIDVAVGANTQRQATVNLCLPLDPDAAARVRVDQPLHSPGGRVRVEVARAPLARELPVSVALLLRENGTLVALATRVISPSDDAVELELPSDVSGQVIVRARPLYGRERHEVRGGSTLIWVAPGQPMEAAITFDETTTSGRLSFSGPARGDRSAYLVALPIDEARQLAGVLRQQTLGPLGDLRQTPAQATAALLAAALAAAVPRDVGAPAVIRARNELVAVPSPQNPISLGLLRDPWRSRARFITGRLALIFRAIEDEVARSLPQRIDDVALHEGGDWRFNSEIVESIAASGNLGSAGASGLGGDPLTIEALQAFDQSFTYNNVARRITRERLFRILLALRTFVQNNGFDLTWSRRGDPAEWLRSLPGHSVPGAGSLRREDLVDGWGRPFQLRRAAGARSRFPFVSPLGGWEIVSSGPDGRFGSVDDMVDPTARVLPQGSHYAEAVGENILVARLSGVELGRATVELLRSSAGVFSRGVGGIPPRPEAATEQLSRQLWSRLPSVLVPPTDALALRRPSEPGDGALGRVVDVSAAGGHIALELDEEPRTWGVVAYAWTRDGFPSVAEVSATTGAPLIVEGQLPRRIRQGEPLTIALQLTNLRNAAVQISSEAETHGPIEVQPPAAINLPAEATNQALFRILGQRPGQSVLSFRFMNSQGELIRQLHFPITVETSLIPMRLRAGAALVPTKRRWRTELPIPSDAETVTGRVVVLTPYGLASDPDLSDVRRRDPALIAWANAMNGQALSPEMRAALSMAQTESGFVEGDEQALSTACAIIAWSAAGADDEESAAALARAQQVFSSAPPFADPDSSAGVFRAAAAVLAAIASGGVPELAEAREAHLDPVAHYAAQLRINLRRAIHLFPEEPTLLARAAAALLLADPRDGHGRAMAQRAAASLEELAHGAARVRPSEGRAGRPESLTATLALAVAAHQMEQDELASRLIRGAFEAENVLTRSGGEVTFWMLAAAAYGALGTGVPERVTVTINGETSEADMRSGRAIIPMQQLRRGRDVSVRVDHIGRPTLLLRAETVMGRHFQSRDQGPFRLELQGDVGGTGELAALELSLTTDREVPSPILEVQLPSGVDSEQLVHVLERSDGILTAQARRPGFLRLHLTPMAEGTQNVVAFPLRWTVQGELRGLGVIAYPESQPHEMTIIAPRELTIEQQAN